MEPPNGSNTKTARSQASSRSSAVRHLVQRQFEKLEANVAEGEHPPSRTNWPPAWSRRDPDRVPGRKVLKGKVNCELVFGRYVILDFLGKGRWARSTRPGTG